MNIKYVGGAVVAAFAVIVLMPEERVSMVKEIVYRVTQPSAMACLDYVRKRMHDPDSARFIDAAPLEGVGSEIKGAITIAYKAKNGYGAYRQGRSNCVVNSGKVDEVGTYTIYLERMNACRERQLNSMRALPYSDTEGRAHAKELFEACSNREDN